MLRAIIAVIVSYILMLVLFFAGIMCLFAFVGSEWGFKPGKFEASNRWLSAVMLLDFVIAIIAGLICALIAKGGRAPLALAILTLVLGISLAFPALSKQKTNSSLVRAGGVSQMEAMQKAYNPTWAAFAFPIVAAIGILIGGKLRRRS